MWAWIVVQIVIAVISYILQPKPKQAQPASAQTLDYPKPQDGASIIVVFGCRDIESANVLYYGNFKTKPIMSGGGGGKK